MENDKKMNYKEALDYIASWGVAVSKSAIYNNKNLFIKKSRREKIFLQSKLDEYISIRKELVSIEKICQIFSITRWKVDNCIKNGAPCEEHFGHLYFDLYEFENWYKQHIKTTSK